jgi:hypothetical protein
MLRKKETISMKSLIIVAAISLLGSSTLFAANTTAKAQSTNEVTKEQREKMAEAHEKMASCLRSDKPWQACHEEMRKDCQENMGDNNCPMWGKGWGPGMKRGRMSQ